MNKNKSIRQSLLIILLGVFFLLACISSQAMATATTVPFTNTPCQEVSWTPPTVSKPVFYFFLIDGTQKYLADGHMENARNVVKLALADLLTSGDRVVLGWINQTTAFYGIEATIFFNDVFFLETTQISPTPTFPPTLPPNSTPTATPTALQQLRQTEIARTVDAARQLEQEMIQSMINEYTCQRGQTIVQIDEINRMLDNMRKESAREFSQTVFDRFPPGEEFKDQNSNPIFESLAETAEFINVECDPSTYSHCVLVIFSDLEDFRQNSPSDQVPPSYMGSDIDVVSVIYNCQFATECSAKTTTWDEHFFHFAAKSFQPVLNKDADKAFYNDTITTEFIRVIRSLTK